MVLACSPITYCSRGAIKTIPPARPNMTMSVNCTPVTVMVDGPVWDDTKEKLPCDHRSWCHVDAGRYTLRWVSVDWPSIDVRMGVIMRASPDIHWST